MNDAKRQYKIILGEASNTFQNLTEYAKEVFMGEIDYIEMGGRLREARQVRKLTQEEAAEKCDITSSYYGNIERGNKKMSVETLGKIAKGMGVPTDWLLFGKITESQEEFLMLLAELQKGADEEQFQKYLAIIKSISTVIDIL